jgi:hypothetical protein
MRISDGITTLIIHDEGAGDFYPGVGGVTFIGAIGGWKINVDTGITKPELGTATAPYMDFNFQATSKLTVPGTLTIEFSDTGFGPLSPNAGGFIVDFNGETAGSITCTTLLGLSDNLWVGTDLASMTFTGAFDCGAWAASTSASSFSLTKKIVISHGASSSPNGLYTRGNSSVYIPDGGTTLALLGCSMLGLGAIRRKLIKV